MLLPFQDRAKFMLTLRLAIHVLAPLFVAVPESSFKD
jgi:hypothetical protein